MTKHHGLGGLNNESCSSPVLEPEVRIKFLVRTLIPVLSERSPWLISGEGSNLVLGEGTLFLV